jgi:hypothetical protein
MKLPSLGQLRIPILLSLAVGECLGLIHFYGHRSFAEFVFVSWSVILFVDFLLSADWSKKRGYSFAGSLISACIVLVALRYWNAGDRISSVLLVSVPVFKASRIGRKLFSPTNPVGSFSWKLHPRDTFGTIAVLFIPILVSWLVVIRSWVYLSSMFWAVFASSLALFITFLVAFMAFLNIKSQRRSCNANDPLKTVADHRGRA